MEADDGVDMDFGAGAAFFGIGQGNGSIWSYWFGFEPLSRPSVRYNSKPVNSAGPWFPPVFEHSSAAYDGWAMVEVAHWFLILLFLVPWLGFLFWRVRKQKKLRP
jgi:hypothetical protein